jgi:hypothetical protein
VAKRNDGRIGDREITEAVSEAQRLYALDQVDDALQLLHIVLERMETLVEVDLDVVASELLHLIIWVNCVSAEMLSDRGMLIQAESRYIRALSLAREYEYGRHGLSTACFINQLLIAGLGLSNVQGWSDRPAEAIQTLNEVVREVSRTHQIDRIEGLEGVFADIDFWGAELGYNNLSYRHSREPVVNRQPENPLACEDLWAEPFGLLGAQYEAFDLEFSGLVNELQNDALSTIEEDLGRLNDILKIVSEWLTLVPRSARVRRYELEMLIRKACTEAELLHDVELYESWPIVEQKYRELVIELPEYAALPRNMATRLCTLSAIVVTRRLPEKEQSLRFFQFAIDREFDAFRMMESRKRDSPMTQADALVWIRLTNLMSYTYLDFGDGSREAKRSAARLIKIRNSFLRNLLKRDPRNEEGLQLLSEYGRANSRSSLRAILFHSKWRWRIVAIE